MPQHREIEGSGSLRLAKHLVLRFDWAASAFVHKYDPNYAEDVRIVLARLEDDDGADSLPVEEGHLRLLGYHTGTEFKFLYDLACEEAELLADAVAHELEFDYEEEAADRADRAYDEWRDRQMEKEHG